MFQIKVIIIIIRASELRVLSQVFCLRLRLINYQRLMETKKSAGSSRVEQSEDKQRK